MAAPEALEQLSLVELTTQRLRAEILSGDLPPGARVVEEQLCRRYGISRAPLREALRLLAEQGLVEHLPRRGARVCDWSPTDIRQLFEIRHVLERHAVLSALPLTTGDGDPLAPVRERLTAMRAAENRGDQLAQDDAHRAFHAAVVGLAGNRQLELTLAPILLYIGLHSPGQGLQRHTAILAALESDVPQTVLDALDRHGEVTYLPSFIGLVHAPEVAWAANPQVALGYLLLGAVCLGYALIRRGEPAAAAGAGDPALHAEEAATPPRGRRRAGRDAGAARTPHDRRGDRRPGLRPARCSVCARAAVQPLERRVSAHAVPAPVVRRPPSRRCASRPRPPG